MRASSSGRWVHSLTFNAQGTLEGVPEGGPGIARLACWAFASRLAKARGSEEADVGAGSITTRAS